MIKTRFDITVLPKVGFPHSSVGKESACNANSNCIPIKESLQYLGWDLFSLYLFILVRYLQVWALFLMSFYNVATWLSFNWAPGQFSSVTQSCPSDSLQPHGLHSRSIINSRSSLKLMSIESVMPSNHLFLCCPLLLLPSIFPSSRVFSNEPILRIRWPGYWSFSFSICPFNKYSGLISFRMDWLDLLAVQGTLKSLLQHHSSKVYFTFYSILVGTKFTWLNIIPLKYPRRDRNKGKL